MAEFNYDLCEERHKTVDARLKNMEDYVAKLCEAINGKFNKIVAMFIGVLLSIIGSLIVMIVSRGL